MIKVFDLFAGVGGFRLAAQNIFNKYSIEYNFIGWSEIDKYCQKTYLANHQAEDEFFIDDIKKITSFTEGLCNNDNYYHTKKIAHIKKSIPNFDFLFAGFPCQSFSKMGNQRGLEDDRGALFFDIACILKSKLPKYFILENVNRILTIDNKKTFLTIQEILHKIGYNFRIFKLDSKDYGVPQTRRRVFICGIKETEQLSNIEMISEPYKTKLKKSTLDILDKNVDDKYILSEKIKKTILSRGSGGYDADPKINLEIARPLTKTMVKMHRAHQDNYYSNKYILGDKEEKWVRKLTPIEAFRLQGFPDKFTINAYNAGLSDAQLYMQAGNSVTINVVEAVLKKLIEEGLLIND